MHIFLMFCLLGVSLLGCRESFDEETIIDKLRVLSIQSSVPEVLPGETFTVEALVVDDDLSEGEITYSWELCAFLQGPRTGYACEPTLTFFRSTTRVFEVTYRSDLQPLIVQACERQAEAAEFVPEGIPLPNCDEGFPAQVRLTVRQEATGEELTALKVVYFALAEEDPQGEARNINPSIVGLRVDPDAELEEGSSARSFGVVCEPDLSVLQEYTRGDETETRQEELLFSWFVRGGDVAQENTYYAEGEVEIEEVHGNTVEPDKDVDRVTVWCVIRDGRGGEDWASLEVELE